TQHSCVDRIGLGQNARRAGKLPHPVGLDQTDFNLRTHQRLDQPPLITAAGFANHLHLGFDLLNPLDELPMARGIVRQTPLLFANGGVQMRPRDIYSTIDKLLFHVINNSCLYDASWPGRSCPRGWPAWSLQ